jgi:hypothetical protein
MMQRARQRRFEALRDVRFLGRLSQLADKNFELLKAGPQHPSLHFKVVGWFRSVRVGLRYRALGIEVPDGITWFWIGTRAEYDRLLA